MALLPESVNIWLPVTLESHHHLPLPHPITRPPSRLPPRVSPPPPPLYPLSLPSAPPLLPTHPHPNHHPHPCWISLTPTTFFSALPSQVSSIPRSVLHPLLRPQGPHTAADYHTVYLPGPQLPSLQFWPGPGGVSLLLPQGAPLAFYRATRRHAISARYAAQGEGGVGHPVSQSSNKNP